MSRIEQAARVALCLAALGGWGAGASGLESAAAEAPQRQTIRRHYDPKDRESGRYQYVPIDVPEGATRLTVEYRYDRAGGQTVIDLGLFEPGPLDLGRARFRGWSGGDRTALTVGPAFSTPGYLPGPVPAGRWHVLLGLYKLAPGGADVEVMVETAREAECPRLPARESAPPASRAGPGWFSGDLHLHTVHSDGSIAASELARRARAAGLDFIAVTDHNNTVHQLEAFDEDGPLRIVGEEVTTPGGHANVWGLGAGDWIDFRALPGDGKIEVLIEAATALGALFSINHPRIACAGCSWEHAIPRGVAAVEIWNGAEGPQEEAIAFWDRLLREGRRVTGVGSSDWHRAPAALGSASVRVHARELSKEAILAGLREGRVVVMADATSPAPHLMARAGGRSAEVGETLAVRRGGRLQVELRAPTLSGGRADLYWNGERVDSAPLQDHSPTRFTRRVGSGGYVRAHLHGVNGAVSAITNPVYVALEGSR